ncbi:MAG TPA: hypothetical protein VKK79_02350 [Candidatus Lokiarchaeia archaeon]|nr:hypothetical protein [Candidatus Lokiarchaeia archaeon]
MFDVNYFNFTDWYFSLPYPAQVGVAIGSIAIAVLAIILAVYIIKWTVLAVYYILKGIFKGLAWVFKKLAGVSTQAKQVGQVEQSPFKQKTPATVAQYPLVTFAPVAVPIGVTPQFCAHCGARVEAKVVARVNAGQPTFCANCGSPLAPEAVAPYTQVV